MTKIEEFIEQGKKLYDCERRSSDPKFLAWKCDVLRFLTKKYGKDSIETTSFEKIKYYHPPMWWPGPPENEYELRKEFQDGLTLAISYLERYKQDEPNDTEETERQNATEMKPDNEVFIVHGRNDGIRARVENLLSKLKIKPIILQEQTNKGLTIIEKVEKHSNVQAVIVLFTSDDVGKLKKDSELEDRARQNVVFEAGFFIGKLGRNNTIILLERGLTLPSDLDGVVHIEIDSDGGWQLKVAKELKGLSFDIDMNCLLNGLD